MLWIERIKRIDRHGEEDCPADIRIPFGKSNALRKSISNSYPLPDTNAVATSPTRCILSFDTRSKVSSGVWWYGR